MKKQIFTALFIALTAVVTIFALGTNLAQANTTNTVHTELETMQLGNQLYSNGHFDEAARLYEQLLATGVQDSALYFNLGNAYWQTGQLGRAIVSYERALALDPRDTAVVQNLSLARSANVDQLETTAISPAHTLAETSRHWLTLNETALLVLVLWYLFAGLLLALRRTRHTAVRAFTLLVAILFLGSGLVLGSRVYVQEVTPTAVVVTEEAPIYVAPDPGSREAFTLHDGTAVTIVDEAGAWVQVSLPGSQLSGWVPHATVEQI